MLRKKGLFIVLACLLALAFSQAAFAGLASMGPVNPVNGTVAAPYGPNGFPQWYKDINGVAVDLPDPPIGAPPPAVVIPTMIFTAVDPAFPYSAQTGFGAEAFYFNATSPKTFTIAGGKAVALLGLEASYANLVPTAGQQVVFARIRLTVPKVPVAGVYTFQHPWGTETINVATAGGAIKFTKDFGISLGWNAGATPGTFTLAPSPGGFFTVLQAGNTMSSFLQAIAPAPPVGWIGDGVNPATFSGSTTGFNAIKVTGPAGSNLDGLGNNFVQSNTMVISGHIPATTAVPMPLTVDRVTCSHPVAGVEHVDVWLTTKPGATITVTDATTLVPLGTGLADAAGKFFESFVSTAASVNVTSGGVVGFTPVTKTAKVIDFVDFIAAKYSLANNNITVQCTTSDFARLVTKPVLTLVGFGPMNVNATSGVYSLTVPLGLTTLKPTVTVTSSTGGSNTTQIAVTP